MRYRSNVDLLLRRHLQRRPNSTSCQHPVSGALFGCDRCAIRETTEVPPCSSLIQGRGGSWIGGMPSAPEADPAMMGHRHRQRPNGGTRLIGRFRACGDAAPTCFHQQPRSPLLCKANRLYLLTCKVNRYCLLALHDGAVFSEEHHAIFCLPVPCLFPKPHRRVHN